MALLRITLQDFVIVEHLELDLHTGFSALTGETGAGKSILLDALQLIMGARADSQVVREGCQKADMVAEFDTTPALMPFLEEAGITADEGTLLLRRTVDTSGKSRGWVNGTPVTAAQLRTLGAYLVDIHGQHAWQSLMHSHSMRDLLDAYGRISTATLRPLWQQWQDTRQQLEQATTHQVQRQQERERLQWQIAEVDKVAPQADEWDTLNTEHQRLSHGQQLLEAAHTALQFIEADQQGLLSNLYKAQSQLQNQQHIEPAFVDMVELLNSAEAQLQEVQHSLQSYISHTELDPERLAQLDQRMAAWLSAARRFKLQPETLAQQWQDWQNQLHALDLADDLNALQANANAAEQAYHAEAKVLSQQRTKAAKALSKAITAAMQDLGMQGGSFVVDISAASPSTHGSDAVDFLVAGHTGVTPRPISKVASGGELSRIALAIAVTTSKLGSTPTLVFDEVDAGIGGQVAHTVGRLMQQLGQDRQVLAVTHLPQVAAAAHHHLHVSKHMHQNSTSSQTRLLTAQQRELEIARMLGGDSQSDTTLAHARAMLEQAQPPQP